LEGLIKTLEGKVNRLGVGAIAITPLTDDIDSFICGFSSVMNCFSALKSLNLG